MPEVWDPAGKEKKYPLQKDYVDRVEEPRFHIGQSYEKRPAKALRCKKCGGREFNVGRGNYYTAIKCTTCQWEMCVHEG